MAERWNVGEYPPGAAVRSVTLYDGEGRPIATIRDAALKDGEVRSISRKEQFATANYIMACVNFFQAMHKGD